MSTLAGFGAAVDALKVLVVPVYYLISLVDLTNIFFLVTVLIFHNFSFQPRIFVLLRRCLFDSDDEVDFSIISSIAFL